MTLLDRDQADRMRQLIGGHGQYRRRGSDRIEIKRRADLLVNRADDRVHRRRVGDAGQTIGVEAPE